MRVKWAALIGANILLASTSVSAQSPVTLGGTQLDGVILAYQYDPSRYQLRVAVDAVAVTDPDRLRDALLMEVPEESMTAMPEEEPEPRCTPARRALLALAGRSESSAGEATSQQGRALTTSAPPIRQAANTGASRLAAASPGPAMVDGSASRAQTDLAISSSSQRTAVGNLGSSARQAVARSGRAPAATATGAGGKREAVSAVAIRARQVEVPIRQAANTGSSRLTAGSQGSGGSPAAIRTSVGSKREPVSAVATRARQVEVPIRTVRADNPSRPSGASALRRGAGASAADIVARVRSEVNSTLSALQGGAFSMRR